MDESVSEVQVEKENLDQQELRVTYEESKNRLWLMKGKLFQLRDADFHVVAQYQLRIAEEARRFRSLESRLEGLPPAPPPTYELELFDEAPASYRGAYKELFERMSDSEMNKLYGEMQFRDFVNEALQYEAAITETLFIQELMSRRGTEDFDKYSRQYETVRSGSVAGALFRFQNEMAKFDEVSNASKGGPRRGEKAAQHKGILQEAKEEIDFLRQAKLDEIKQVLGHGVKELQKLTIDGVHGVMVKLREMPVKETWQRFIQFGGNLVDLVKGKVVEITPAIKEAVLSGGETVNGAIKKSLPLIAGAGEKLSSGVKAASSAVKGLFGKGWPALTAMAGAALVSGKKAAEALPLIKSSLVEGATTAQQIVGKFMEEAIPVMQNAAALAKEAGPVVVKIPEALMAGMRSIGMVSGGAARESASLLYQGGSAFFEAALPAMRATLQTTLEAGAAAFKTATPVVQAVVKGLIEVVAKAPVIAAKVAEGVAQGVVAIIPK